MDSVGQFQRYETSYRMLSSEFNSVKEELDYLKKEFTQVVDENKKLRQDLKDSITNQLSTYNHDPKSVKNWSDVERDTIHNLEKQLELMRKERDNAVQMWQKSLVIITQLEQDVKTLQFRLAPQSMSFEIELKKRQEEFERREASLVKEISILRAETNKKEEDVIESKLKQNELLLQIENLNSQINQKNQDRRNLIRKEYGYDDALISLQNDINDLETKIISLNKDNQYLKESLHEANNKIISQNKVNIEQDRKNSELRIQLEEQINLIQKLRTEKQQIELIDLKHKENNDRLNIAIGDLMDTAAMKAQHEIESIKKIYNTNLGKLIEECNFLETDRNTKAAQLEKAIRSKKTVEEEMEKLRNENLRINTKENLSYEDLYRRLCLIERDREQALTKLESRESEIKKLQTMIDNEKEKNQQVLYEFQQKTNKTSLDLERLTDDHAKLLNELENHKLTISNLQVERDNLQKKLTRDIQMYESEIKLKVSDHVNKVKCLEDNHARAMFDLRQLLNMQQRMSNKWKEECHLLTTQSEAKFVEMKKNFENIRANNDKLYSDLQHSRRKEVEHERMIEAYNVKIKDLESRLRDAEEQATQATRRIAKEIAKEKMMAYEKHLLESDLDRVKFNDIFYKERDFLISRSKQEFQANQTQKDEISSSSDKN